MHCRDVDAVREDEREAQGFDRVALSLSLSGKRAASSMDTKDQGWMGTGGPAVLQQFRLASRKQFCGKSNGLTRYMANYLQNLVNRPQNMKVRLAKM